MRPLKIIIFCLISNYVHSIEVLDGGVLSGNGGDVLECKTKTNGKKYELLDTFEGRELRKLDIKQANGTSLDEKVREYIKRSNVYGSDLENLLLSYYESFFEETFFVNKSRLAQVDDSLHLFIPENCQLSQIVLQLKPEFKNDKRYFINKSLWDKLTVDTKSHVIIHELVYRLLIDSPKQANRKPRHSKNVRLLTALIVSDKISDFFDVSSFLDFLTTKLLYSCQNATIDTSLNKIKCEGTLVLKSFLIGSTFEALRPKNDLNEADTLMKTEFIDQRTVRLTDICLYPKYDNIETSAVVGYKIRDQEIIFSESIIKTNYTNDGRYYCTLISNKLIQSIEIINNDNIVMDGIVWTRSL